MTDELITINISLYKNMFLRFDAPYEYLSALKEYFSAFVPNYQHLPKFRGSAWDGRISVFDGRTRSLPYGLIFDVIEFHQEQFPTWRLKIDEPAKRKFGTFVLPPKVIYNLTEKKPIRDYQKQCIEKCLHWRSGIIRCATGGGKSLIIAYIIKTLSEQKLANKQLIIVPTLGLIEQFVGDLVEYGLSKKLIGRVNADSKEFDSPIVIATWQTLANNYNKLNQYDTVIIDETHSAKATVIRSVLENATKATFRFGFTGTMN